MTKIIIKYISFFLVYLYIHIFFVIFMQKFCFSLQIKYYSHINLSYKILLRYKDYFKLTEKSFYTSFDTKKIILKNQTPILQINDTLFFNYNFGISKSLYLHYNDILEALPKIYSEISLNQINSFLIKLIHKQYTNFNIICNEYPTIIIINKKLILIKSKKANFLLAPWNIISKEDYKRIIKEKITDFRLSKNKDFKNELF